MTAEYAQADRFRGARIHLCDLAGLDVRGHVNDVDVTTYVEAQLDRQHPTRVLARNATSPDGYRAVWDAIETLWESTLDRARLLPEAKPHERVDGEWSLVETQRHLLFASDAWVGNAVLEDETPYHPLGFPAGGMPADATANLGLTLEATPTLDAVLAPRLLRMARMRRVVEGLTEATRTRLYAVRRRALIVIMWGESRGRRSVRCPRSRARLLLGCSDSDEQQRIALARLILKSPSPIHTDEPTAALDHRQFQGIIQLVGALQPRMANDMAADAWKIGSSRHQEVGPRISLQSLESPWQVRFPPSLVNDPKRHMRRSEAICPSLPTTLIHAGAVRDVLRPVGVTSR